MAVEKKDIHCLHICGHIEARMEEKATKEYEEKMLAKKPIPCSTDEDSGQLHEMYKDRVKGTEPSEEKAKMMQELMAAIEHAQLVHSMTLLRAKEEEIGLKRHPSTLSHMHHDDSDSEGELEDIPHTDVEAPTNATVGANIETPLIAGADEVQETDDGHLAVEVPNIVVSQTDIAETVADVPDPEQDHVAETDEAGNCDECEADQ